MIWNWQQADRPNFTCDAEALRPLEDKFLRGGGMLIGATTHLSELDRGAVTIELMSTEAVTTSAIEGEILDRESVQSSIRRQFGLAVEGLRANPAEQGIAELMVNLYRQFAAPLDATPLFRLQGGTASAMHQLGKTI